MGKITDDLRAIFMAQTGDEKPIPGYALIDDRRLEGSLSVSPLEMAFRIDVVEAFTVYPRATVEVYLDDGSLLYTGAMAEMVVAAPGEVFTLTANLRVE